MKKLLCAVLAIVTLVACLVGFKANEEKPLPVYREVEDVPQKGNLVTRIERQGFGFDPEEERKTRDYEKYMQSLNLPKDFLPENELQFSPFQYGRFDDLCGLTVIITSQEELSCYYARLIEQMETMLAEYKDSHPLDTLTEHRAMLVSRSIMWMENRIERLHRSYKMVKEAIDFESQVFICLGYVHRDSRIIVDGNRLLVLEEGSHGDSEWLNILVDKENLPAAVNEIEIITFRRNGVAEYAEWETAYGLAKGYARVNTRIFFDPVAE